MASDTAVLPAPTTFPALIAARASADADLRAIVTADAAITYGELDHASAALGSRLIAAGVVKGDRVGLLAPNGIDWAIAAVAVLRIGAVLVPLSTLLRPPELQAQLATARVTHLLMQPVFRDRRYLDDLDAAAPGLVEATRSGRRHPAAPSLRAAWIMDGLHPGATPTASPGGGVPPGAVGLEFVQAMEERVRPADDFAILFTSGSRGAPKGTIHTHGSALRAIAAGLHARCVGPGERLYIPMPFFWTGGFSGGLLSALVAGATLLTEAEPEPSATLALLERERATLFRGWPDQAARLAAHPAFAATDLSSLGNGSLGAVLPAARRPAPGARPNLFGMTESFGPYCGDRLDIDLPPDKFGSCGRPFEGVEVRIVDPDTGADAPPAEQGEISLRGANLMRGICGRHRSEVFTADGWYRTGDLGRRDADGYLWYGGRLDDMIKVKGATVYPAEVEAALRSIDGVRQAHVAAVATTAGVSEIGAVVVTDASLDAIRAGARERLSAFKVPSRWLLTADAERVPMLASGKVDLTALHSLLDDPTRGNQS